MIKSLLKRTTGVLDYELPTLESLLSKTPSADEFPGSVPENNPLVAEELKRPEYLKYAILAGAAYSLSSEALKRNIASYTQTQNLSIVHFYNIGAGSFQGSKLQLLNQIHRPWALLKENNSSNYVVIVRGTASLADLVADLYSVDISYLMPKPKPDLKIDVHATMYEAAERIWKQVKPLLQKDVNSVFFTGHSLGAGIASFLTLLAYMDIGQGGGGNVNIQGIGYATPAVMSRCDPLEEIFTTVVYGDDMIPRLSFYTAQITFGTLGVIPMTRHPAPLYPGGTIYRILKDRVYQAQNRDFCYLIRNENMLAHHYMNNFLEYFSNGEIKQLVLG